MSQDTKEVSSQIPKKYQASTERGIRRDTQQSKDNLTDSLKEAPPSSSALEGPSSVVAEKRGSGEEEREWKPSSDNSTAEQAKPDYRDIKTAILSSWPTFSATTVSRHMQTHGAAKTLEVVECAARLQKTDINKVLEKPLMAWAAPQVTETEYAPADETIDGAHIAGPVPQRYWGSRQRSKGAAA
jgi:hypothetical protein